MPLSNEQKYAFEKFKQGQNLVITGPGGTGKSELIKHFVAHAALINKPLQVTALTGCAALLIGSSAKTIHSWSGIKLGKGPIDEIIAKTLKSRKAKKNWKKTQVLIIDEASMMSKKMYDLLDRLAQAMRFNNRPFGNMQVILVGDFYQLPPICSDGEPDTGRFCFESENYYKAFPIEQHVVLKTIYRQNDPVYIKILNEIREGELSDSSIEILNQYVNREYDMEQNNGVSLTKLFPTRSKVETTNHIMFERIKDDSIDCKAVTIQNAVAYAESGKIIESDKMELCQSLSSRERDQETEQLMNNSPMMPVLSLKKGATVMCTANIGMENGVCNGSQGIVIDFVGRENIPKVKFSNGHVMLMERHTWQSDVYPTICVKQYPLVLAWALTIHKIQGTTLTNAQMDIGNDIFAYGQSYVALSRIRSLDGLYLSSFVPSKVKADPRVKAFYSQLPEVVVVPQVGVVPEVAVEQDNTSETIKKVNIFASYELQEESYDDSSTVKKIPFHL